MSTFLVLSEEGLILPYIGHGDVVGIYLHKLEQGTAVVSIGHREVLSAGFHAIPGGICLCINAEHSLFALYGDKL